MLKNETHIQMHEDVIRLFDKQTYEQLAELDLVSTLGLYRAAFANEQEAVNIIVKNRFTNMLVKQDRSRDDIFRGLYYTVKGLCFHPDPERQKAAKRLMDIFNHYGNIARKPADAESAAITDLMREFRRPDLTADIETVNVGEWVEMLAEANENYKRFTVKRFQEASGKTAYRTRSTRPVTDKYYRNIVMHLEYMITVGKETQTLSDLVGNLNIIVKRYKNSIAQKAGKKKAATETEPEK
jgi:hypothetical protein